MVDSIDDLLAKLAMKGGCIISSANLSVAEIAEAKLKNCMCVNESGLGFIYKSQEWMYSQGEDY